MSTARFNTLQNAAGSVSVPVDTVVNGSAKAWVNFNGTGTVAIRAAFNVSSITDNGTGDYTANFTTSMADANYSTQLSRDGNGFIRITTLAASTIRTQTTAANSGGNIGGVVEDVGTVTVAIFR